MSSLQYSVVIPTRGELNKLGQCIESIENACEKSRLRSEVEIIVINTGHQSIIDYRKGAKEHTKLRIMDCPKMTVSRARNYGISVGRGRYIVFLDDDAYVDGNFFNKADKYLMDLKHRCVCGRLINPDDMKSITKYENLAKNKDLRRIDYNFFRGACILIEKTLIERIGCFDEKYGPGGKYYSAEESDLFFRLKKSRINVIFAADLVFYHPIETIIASEKVFRYSYATGSLLINHLSKDKMHAPIYLYLLFRVLMICQIRIVQGLVFPGPFEARDQKHRYSEVIKGIVKAIMDKK